MLSNKEVPAPLAAASNLAKNEPNRGNSKLLPLNLSQTIAVVGPHSNCTQVRGHDS